MAHPRGYATWTTPGGRRVEHDTATCRHCGAIVFLGRGKVGMCLMCDAVICEACARQGKCTPFEKKLEIAERRDILRRRLGLC